jgi:hypothetical protein
MNWQDVGWSGGILRARCSLGRTRLMEKECFGGTAPQAGSGLTG